MNDFNAKQMIADILDSFPRIALYFPVGKLDFETFYNSRLKDKRVSDSKESKDFLVRECKEILNEFYNLPTKEQDWIEEEIKVNGFLEWLTNYNPGEGSSIDPIDEACKEIFNSKKNLCFRNDPNPDKIKIAAFCQLVFESKMINGNPKHKNKLSNKVAQFYFSMPNLDIQYKDKGIETHKSRMMQYFPNLQ